MVMDATSPTRSLWQHVSMKLKDAASLRAWSIDVNDGIIATAGVLQGFAGAGASTRILIIAVIVTTISGALSLGGAKWSETAAERDAQLTLLADEQAQLALNPEEEFAELVSHYLEKGLTPELAHQVAEQLSAKDALSAQLETEHGIDELIPPNGPILEGLAAALGFATGAAVPLLITLFTPVSIGTGLIVVAVVLSLAISSLVTARGGQVPVWRALARTLAVGIGTMAVSFLVGTLLL